MPNYCYNIIEISGDEDEINKMVELIEGEETEFDFNKVLPYPEKYAMLDKKCNEMRDNKVDLKNIPTDGFNSGGYEWCISNWGTKWNAIEAVVSALGDVAEISFDTAWSPSLELTKALSELFPTLDFKHSYEEGGCDFSGYILFENGDILEDKSGNYESYPISEHEVWDDEDEDE